MANAVPHNNLTASPVVRTIEGNVKWQGPLSFNFVTTPAEGRAFAGLGGGEAALPADWMAQIETVLKAFDDLVALDVTVTTSAQADYLIGVETDPGNLGSANGPGAVEPGAYLGLLLNVSAPANAAEAERGGGSERLQTIAHEIGHTLGLNHPHGDDDGSTVAPGSADEGFTMRQPYLGHQTTLSYAAAPNTIDSGDPFNFAFGRSVAPMAIDIAALHRLYGANGETRTGNTVYRLTDAGSADLDLSSEDGILSVGRAYYGIWDAGTADTDTIRYDGAANALINLMAATPNGGEAAARAEAAVSRLAETGILDGLSAQARAEIADARIHPGGFFSSVLTEDGTRVPGGYAIAQGAVIETASGGSGNDILIGNEANNILIGNGGDDVMAGGAGDDVARFAGAFGGYTLGREGGAVTVGGPSGADRVYDVEALAFRDSFVLIGTTTTLSDAQVATLGYLYEAGLDRNGALDVAGVTYWLGAREDGLSEEAVAGYFLGSAEFTARSGAVDGLSDRALVETLYRNVLDREGESAGVDFWVGKLGEDAFSRGDLLLGFAESAENRATAPVLGVFDDAIM